MLTAGPAGEEGDAHASTIARLNPPLQVRAQAVPRLKETAAGRTNSSTLPEHLLRLFVKLPELLAQCKMQREHMQVLVSKLMELLKFIQANKAKYFVTQYESATDEYLAWWGNE